MNCNKVLLVALSVFGLSTSQAQFNVLNAKSPDEFGVKPDSLKALDNDNPLPYGYINEERDVLWGTMVWEIIDLEQRVNFPLYFPTEDNLGSERRSLFNVLISAIESGDITQIYSDSYFRSKKSLDEVKMSFSYKELSSWGIEKMAEYPGMTEEQMVEQGLLTSEHYSTSEVTGADVTQYAIRGYWYFDSRQGELKYRLIGICPKAAPALDKLRSEGGPTEPIELFWIYFPDARKTLHNALAFNASNSSSPFTFDHVLNSRRFSSYIYKEENPYGDRKIEEYLRDNSQFQLLESERIKEKIRSFEQDMWSY